MAFECRPHHCPLAAPKAAAAFRQLVWTSLIMLLIAGCARMGHVSLPLAGTERSHVLERYREYLQRGPLCSGIEADIRLRYRSVLKDAGISGVLLAKRPASLKFLGLSPLGQPLLLLSLHDDRFVFVDVQGQKGYTGKLTARKVAELLPVEKLADEGLFVLLTGKPAIPLDEGLVVVSPAREGTGRYLLSWPAGDEHRKQVVFDGAAGQVEAFRLLDAAGQMLLEIGYSHEREERCGVPNSLSISGSEVRGSVECAFEQVFRADSLPASDFELAVPESFTMEEVR